MAEMSLLGVSAEVNAGIGIRGEINIISSVCFCD